MQAYPVLQSGFISLTQNGMRKPEVIEPSLRQEIIFKEYKVPLKKFFFNPEVSELFIRWCNNPKCLKEFDFREKLIETAFDAFGGPSFYSWMALQNNKPTISDLHTAFLFETLEYLLIDKPRQIQPVQWTRLLEADAKTHSVKIDLTKYFGTETLGVNSSVRLPVKLDKVIGMWLKKPGGFEDLLISLFVIFGDRTQRTDITDMTA